MKMSGLLFVGIVVLLLSGAAKSHPVPFDGESRSQIQVGKDILSQSQSVRLLRRADDSNAIPTTSTDKQDLSTSGSKNATARREYGESKANDIVEILKALKLPVDFAGVTKLSTPRNSTIEKPSEKNNSSSAGPSPIASASSQSVASADLPTSSRQYMTGNAMLDKIMNCPCDQEQLAAMGVKGVKRSPNPNPAIYAEPPYGPDMLGPGDVIATNLKSVGGSTGNVFGQIIRLLLSAPALLISVLKPLLTGIVDTLAQTTDAAAVVAGTKAKQLPVVLRSGGLVIKRLLETTGDVTGSFLYVFSNLIAALAGAQTSLAGTLPFAFDILGDMTASLGNLVGTLVDFVSGTLEPLSTGVITAGKTGGNLFSGLIEGSKGFKNGLLEGIKYGVNDETPPADPNAPAWRR